MKRKYTALFLACMMLFSISEFSGMGMISHAAALEFEGGSGTVEDPWQIATADQLDNVRNYLGAHYILVNNIDLNVAPYNEGAGWEPIGYFMDDMPFRGSFNGNGKIIKGLTINRPDSNDIGLFGHTAFADIKNVSLIGVAIIGGNYIGSLIGSNNGGNISNCYARGSVEGTDKVGGLVGENYFANLTNTYAVVSVSGITSIGGLVGSIIDATTTSSYYNSEIALLSDTGKGEPRDTADMTYPYNADNTYIGWDFDNVWDIQAGVNDGYPFLGQQQIEPPGEFAGGDGSEANPFQITTAAHLNNIRNYQGSTHTDKHFLLMNDIDLTDYLASGGDGYNDGKGWLPIGYAPVDNLNDTTTSFFGSFDGVGHAITGLFIDRQPTEYEEYELCGLFGSVYNAKIADLTLRVDVNGTAYVGGLAGVVMSSTLENIKIEGTVNGNSWYVGGLAGTARNTKITDCSVSGSVGSSSSNPSNVGGLIGSGYSADIQGCQTNAIVTGNSSVGGLVGDASQATSITNSHAAGSVSGTGNYIGGIVGYNFNSMAFKSYATSNVSGNQYVGGFCGTNDNSPVTESYATGSVSGYNWVGGLVGLNMDSSLVDTYAVGAVSGSSSSDYVGGLVGWNNKPYVVNSFYDAETTGYSDIYNTNYKGTSKTTVEMMQEATFTDWDFVNVWGIEENVTYPYLLGEPIIPTMFTVTFNGNGGTPSSDSLQVEDGGTVTTLPTASREGYTFEGWNTAADGSGSAFTTESLVTEDITVYAQWEDLPPISGHLVSVSADPPKGGTVTGGGNYETGDRVKVTATANVNFTFLHWTEGSTVVCKGETYNFKMGIEKRDLVAHFMEVEQADEWLVTVSARPSEGGTVEGEGMYGEGQWVEVRATPKTGYRFINWTEGLNGVSTETEYGFEMGTSSRSLTANFLAEGSGWPKGVRLSATNITANSVTLVLSGPVPDAVQFRVYSGDGLYREFPATDGTDMLLDELDPMTFYTFIVQAVFTDEVETSDGPAIKVKTKK